MKYFKEHGNLNQFNGSKILEKNKPYMDDTWFLHTIMGGMAQVTAVINKITSDEIIVTYGNVSAELVVSCLRVFILNIK